MKTALAIALVALSGSLARADEPAAAPAPAPNAQAAPEAKVEAQAPAPAVGTEVAPGAKAAPPAQAVFQATRGNFCGQARVLDWMMQTEVGQRLQREHEAQAAWTLAEWEAEAERQPTLPEIAAPK